MIITPIKTRIFLEGEDILSFIEEHIFFGHAQKLNPPSPLSTPGGSLFSQSSNSPFQGGIEHPGKFILEDGDILVITSKIVALAEGRTFLNIDEDTKLRYIQEEASYYVKTKYVHLTIHDRIPMANAGIDESNGNGKCIMLPRNSYESAYDIWYTLREKYAIADLGIIITDSRTIPFRNGTTGASLGHAGFEGIRNYVGESDLFGRSFHYARTNVPDALATAAVHTMGEGDECQPLAIIKNPLVTYSEERQTGDDLIIDPGDDMYGPLFAR